MGACVQTQTVVEHGDIDVHAYHRAIADKNATTILKQTTCIEKHVFADMRGLICSGIRASKVLPCRQNLIKACLSIILPVQI